MWQTGIIESECWIMNYRVLMSWFVCIAAMAAWGVAEWMPGCLCAAQ